MKDLGVYERIACTRNGRVLTSNALSLTVPVWVVMHEDLRTSTGCRLLFDAIATDLAPLLYDNAP